MSGETHAAIGAATSLVFAVTIGSSFMLGSKESMIVCAGVAAIGGLFPDLDVKKSAGNKMLNNVFKTALPLVAVILVAQIVDIWRHSKGHMEITRVLGILWLRFSHLAGGFTSPKQLVALIVLIGLAFFGKSRPHREATHSLIMMVATTGCMFVMFSNNYWIWFGIGYLSHLALDYFNTKGESILWPAPGKFCLSLCSASGAANKALKYVGMVVTALVLVII